MEVITDMVLNGQIERETISKSYLQGSGTNASLVELLKLKLQTVKHFLQAQRCVKKGILVGLLGLLDLYFFWWVLRLFLLGRLRCRAASSMYLT